MASPAIDIRTSMAAVDGLLVVSLPGELSDTVLNRIVADITQRVTEDSIRGVILNLSTVTLLDMAEFQVLRHLVQTNEVLGVPTVDTAVANQLIKITKATRIMGCETLVSGVSSSIAHTIVELGVDISELRTTATLKDAFSTCLSEMGVLDLQRGRMPFRSQQPTLHRQRTYR